MLLAFEVATATCSSTLATFETEALMHELDQLDHDWGSAGAVEVQVCFLGERQEEPAIH